MEGHYDCRNEQPEPDWISNNFSLCQNQQTSPKIFSLENNNGTVIQNKSSLLLKRIFTNTETLQQFTMNNKTEIIYKMPSSKVQVERSWILKLEGQSVKVESKSEELWIKIREYTVQMNVCNQSKPLLDRPIPI